MKKTCMTKKKWFDHFKGKSKDYIPLVVNVPNPDSPKYTRQEMWEEPQKALEWPVSAQKFKLKVGSDCTGFAESNFLENLLPCIFGGETYFAPGGRVGVRPFIEDIYHASRIQVKDIFCPETEKAAKHLEYMRDNAPDGFYISPTRFLSPLDCAVVMRSGDFYMDLILEPELAVEFMNKIADVTIETIKFFKKITNQPLEENVTPRGIFFPGLRLTGDAVVNLSPNMISEIMCPIYKRFEDEFGSVMLHYCCKPAPSGHVIGALAKGGGVICMDNWQGYQSIFNGNEMQTEVGVCTDVNKDEILSGRIFDNPFFMMTDRPLVLGTGAETVDEGKKIYDIWRNHFEKRNRR